MQSVLIANRGEIAVRVIRAAQELGLRTIAIYSELDRDARHTDMADEAWSVGPAPAAESYLNATKILEVAAEASADAVHPGYGFLAENADFARRVIDAGMIWVGPSPESIATMGDKIASRRAAEAAGVAGVPGTLEPLASPDEVETFAQSHGYPIAIKAAHGGGGRGLKVVRNAGELQAAFESAKREAEAWFGSPEVYLERYLERPRHVEAQIIGDTHGNVVFLGERDCSIQRRHQKLVEESPAPNFSARQRARLGESAIALAKATSYVSAGTIEFLMDETGELYFLEMNTRIQVEHTVSEMVTGIDLVKEQLRIAAGDVLTFSENPGPIGHAIEFRINAEDPGQDFRPSPGTLVDYREPGGFGIRVDSGVVAGDTISQYYDNMIAKLVVWGRDRNEAIERGKRALASFVVTGVPTTIPAHQRIIGTEAFSSGDVSTGFLADHVSLADVSHPSAATLPEDEELQERSLTVEVGGRRHEVKFWTVAAPQTGGGSQRATPRRRAPKLDKDAMLGEGAGIVSAPMQGTIVKVHHGAGAKVTAGEAVCVLEAMKMENEILAPIDGEIVDLRVQPGDTIANGAIIMVIR